MLLMTLDRITKAVEDSFVKLFPIFSSEKQDEILRFEKEVSEMACQGFDMIPQMSHKHLKYEKFKPVKNENLRRSQPSDLK